MMRAWRADWFDVCSPRPEDGRIVDCDGRIVCRDVGRFDIVW